MHLKDTYPISQDENFKIPLKLGRSVSNSVKINALSSSLIRAEYTIE